MENTSEVPQVSMANTKKELLEAYSAAKSLLKAKEKDLLDAEKARKALEKKAALAEQWAIELAKPQEKAATQNKTIIFTYKGKPIR